MTQETEEVSKPEEAKPKSPQELYQDMIAAKRAYEEKKIYETYLLYQLAKRKTIKAI